LLAVGRIRGIPVKRPCSGILATINGEERGDCLTLRLPVASSRVSMANC
jgi:hypothetical protein